MGEPVPPEQEHVDNWSAPPVLRELAACWDSFVVASACEAVASAHLAVRALADHYLAAEPFEQLVAVVWGVGTAAVVEPRVAQVVVAVAAVLVAVVDPAAVASFSSSTLYSSPTVAIVASKC